MRRIGLVLVAAFAASLSFAVHAQIYLQIDGIPGGAQAEGHEHWIEILTVQVGGQVVSADKPHAITFPPGAQSVTFTKRPDVASAGLSAALASKRELGDMRFEIANPPGRDYARLDLRTFSDGVTRKVWTVASLTGAGTVETVVLALGPSGPAATVPTPASSKVTGARAAIYLCIDSIPGGVQVKGFARCIDILTMQAGGQVVSAAAPYALTLSPGTKSFTFTKRPDMASAGLSAALASKRPLGNVKVDIVHPHLDARGAPIGSQGTQVNLSSPTVASITSTGAVETVVLTLGGSARK